MKKNTKKIYKIGIDARFYGPVGKGLGRYTQELVDRILSLDKDNYYVIFLSPNNFANFKINSPRHKKILVKARWYSFKEQIFFPWQIMREGLDLMHFTHFNVPILLFKKYIVTIHDLILIRLPDRKNSKLNKIMYKLKYLAYKLVIRQAIFRAKKIITVSHFTKQDVLQEYRIKSDKIEVIYEGVFSSDYRKINSDLNDKTILKRYNIKEESKFLLYVGNAYPHKNLEGLLKIFKNLSKDDKDMYLVLVGQIDYFYNKIKKLAKEFNLNSSNSTDKVLFLGYVPDNHLQILFAKAYAYIFPSYYEGFGLPPLEAMAMSCPVISSDKGSLPEILGPAAYYFDPYKIKQAVKRIKYFLESDKLKADLIAKGLERVKLYDWQSCTQKTLQVYKKIL